MANANSTRVHTCRHCGAKFTGRKKKYCSDQCAAEAKLIRDRKTGERRRRARGQPPKTGKPREYYTSPLYKRIARFRKARREGRNPVYKPLDDGDRAIYRAHQARVKAWKDYLNACDLVDRGEWPKAPYGYPMTDEQRRMSSSREWRWRYENDPDFRARTLLYVKTSKYRRRLKQEATDDGTVTLDCFDQRANCPYCGVKLTPANRTLDHMDPLSLGGAHSVSNVTECCKSCNSRKHAKPFDQWLEELDEPYRSRALAEYTRKHGAPPEQRPLF